MKHFLSAVFSYSYHCAEFDTADVQCYEEVRRMAPFQRRVLVLVGAHGVGRRSLKERLIKDDPRRFAAAMPRKFMPVLVGRQLVEICVNVHAE